MLSAETFGLNDLEFPGSRQGALVRPADVVRRPWAVERAGVPPRARRMERKHNRCCHRRAARARQLTVSGSVSAIGRLPRSRGCQAMRAGELGDLADGAHGLGSIERAVVELREPVHVLRADPAEGRADAR